jgi:N6-adenosine-specific RNA methylase IME4
VGARRTGGFEVPGPGAYTLLGGIHREVSTETSLIKLDAFQQALAEAETIPDVKTLADNADLFKQWLKKQRAGREAQNTGAIMCLMAQRKLGAMLKEQVTPGNPQLLHNATIGLNELGIERTASHRWQKLAEIPEDTFQEFIDNYNETQDEITTIALIRFWSKKTIKPLLESMPLPEGLFSVIACDPPWQYGTTYNPDSRRVAAPYSEMSYEQLSVLEIPSADDSILWLWTTNAFMHDAYHLLEDWGFQHKTILTWFKDKIGVGYWLRGETEHCLLAIKGKPKINHEKALSTHLKVKSLNHSKKPNEFYELIEDLCGEATEKTHLEMFAREKRPNWATWGNELSKSN